MMSTYGLATGVTRWNSPKVTRPNRAMMARNIPAMVMKLFHSGVSWGGCSAVPASRRGDGGGCTSASCWPGSDVMITGGLILRHGGPNCNLKPPRCEAKSTPRGAHRLTTTSGTTAQGPLSQSWRSNMKRTRNPARDNRAEFRASFLLRTCQAAGGQQFLATAELGGDNRYCSLSICFGRQRRTEQHLPQLLDRFQLLPVPPPGTPGRSATGLPAGRPPSRRASMSSNPRGSESNRWGRPSRRRRTH